MTSLSCLNLTTTPGSAPSMRSDASRICPLSGLLLLFTAAFPGQELIQEDYNISPDAVYNPNEA